MPFDPTQPFETSPPAGVKPPFDPSQPLDTQAPGTPASVAPVVASAKAPFDPSQPFSTAPTAQELAQQDHSAIFQHAAPNFNPDDPWADPEMETAYQADRLRHERGIGAKTGEFVKAIPGGLWQGVKGIGKFALGIPQALFNEGQGAYRQAIGDQRYLTNQAQATLAAQHGEESVKNLAGAISSVALRNIDGGSDALLEASGVPKSTLASLTQEQRQEMVRRMLFVQRIQQAQNEMKLAQGRPLDTGAIASLYHAAGQQPSEDISPEALHQAGVDQADLGTVENMAAAGDPNMLLLAKAPMFPGAGKVGGRIAQGVGKAAQVPMNAAEWLASKGLGHLGSKGKIAAAMMGGGAAIEAAPALLHHPWIAAAAVGAKGLQIVGRAAESQGAELATGIPSELSQNVAKAAATGKSATKGAIYDAAQLRAGNAVAQGASTAVGMAPINAVTANGDPEQLAQSETGAAAFGGAFGGLGRNRPMMVEAVRPFLRQEGTRAMAEAADANDPLAIKSTAYIASLPEPARNSVLETIGALQGLPATQGENPQRAKIYVLNDSDYTKAIEDNFGKEQAASGGGRGFFLTQEGKAFVNGDYHSGLDPSQLNHTVGHEFGGHAAINVMQAMGAKGGALYNGLVNSVRAKLMPNGRPSADFYRFVREYNRAFDKTGQTQRLSFNDPEAIEEYIAETAGQIMAGRGAGELALPQTVQDKFNQGIGQFMGKFLGLDPRKVGTATNFGRKEVGALTQAVQDTLGQVVGMKLRGGAEIPEAPKSSQRRIDELNSVLAKPRPAATAPLTDMQAWNTEQKAARSELSQLQGQQTGAFPASGQPPVAPSKPGVIVSPDAITTDALKALDVMGIKGAKANALIRQANAQHGAPINDAGQLASAAFRIHGGGAVKPGEFTAKPVDTTPVPVPQGTFKDETGTERTITGASPNGPRVGDVVATREGEIRRVTRAIGDTVDTARTTDPLNARGTKTHKMGDVQALAHDYAPTPTEATAGQASSPAPPALSVQARGDRFIVVDAAGNPVGSNTFGSEAAARQSIAKTGKPSTFGLPPSPNGNDILDAIMENGGINLSGLSKEEREAYFPHKGIWRNSLTSDNPANTPDEIARLVAPTEDNPGGHGDGHIGTLFDEITKAISSRNQFRDQQAAAEKSAKTAEKNAPNEPTPETPNGKLPEGGTTVQERDGEGVAPAEPVSLPTPEHLEQIAAQAREQFLADKEPAKSGKNKGQHTAANVKAAEKSAFDAAAAAHAETVPENYHGLRQRTDVFGQKSVSGKVDPSRPFDAWLIKQALDSGHLTPESLKTLLSLQDSIGKTVSYDYGHAPVGEEGDMPTKEGRAAAQAESSVADRLAGGPIQTERKTSVPLRVGFNSGTKSFSVYGASQEKLLNNFNHLSEKMGDLGIPIPFKDINDPRFVAAFKAIIRNQEHGWTGDGKQPSAGTEEFPNRPDYEWKNSPEHQVVPDDQFQFINAILADEGAKPPKRGDATISKAKAHLANENQRLLNAEGETNPLRQKINDSEPGWTKSTLEDPLNENISPALASNLGPASQSDESIRVHGKVGDISRFFDQGKTPNRAKTAAGFLPETGPKSAKERAQERMNARLSSESKPSTEEPAPAAPAQSGSPQDRLSTEGTSPKVAQKGQFLPDTGTPEEGETAGERLMREAEAAGLEPSIDTIKGILKGDQAAFDKLRAMILSRTGKPARFLPGTQMSSKEAARARIQSRLVAPAPDRKRVLMQPQ